VLQLAEGAENDHVGEFARCALVLICWLSR
jgi:hypothetical protein